MNANNNPENLTLDEIKSKIVHLEDNIHVARMRHGSDKYCQNRIKRVALLWTYYKQYNQN